VLQDVTCAIESNCWKPLKPFIFREIIIKIKSLNDEYQGVVERLHWLRTELRYGNNLKDEGYYKVRQLINPKMGNQQPSL
jgi:hypothetical protein